MAQLERAQPWLGTWVSSRVESGQHSSRALQQAVDAAFAVIAEVQQRLSVHDPTSELSHLNRQGHITPVAVSTPLWQVLRRACQLWQWSGGAFDCVRAAACLRDWGVLPDGCKDNPQMDPATTADVVLLPGQRVGFRRPLGLDFGGIAKGYAVDRAVIALWQQGIRTALINAGGDLRVLGAQAQPIWIREGQDSQQVRLLGELAQGACATSAVYYSTQIRPDGKPCSALVDPHHDQPLLQAHSYTVLARSACWADGLTKVLAVQGPARAAPLLRRLGAIGLVLDAAGEIISTSTL